MEEILNKYIDKIENDDASQYNYEWVVDMLKDIKYELNNLNK